MAKEAEVRRHAFIPIERLEGCKASRSDMTWGSSGSCRDKCNRQSSETFLRQRPSFLR